MCIGHKHWCTSTTHTSPPITNIHLHLVHDTREEESDMHDDELGLVLDFVDHLTLSLSAGQQQNLTFSFMSNATMQASKQEVAGGVA